MQSLTGWKQGTRKVLMSFWCLEVAWRNDVRGVSARFVNPKDFPEVFYYAEAPWTVDMVGHGKLRRILVWWCIGHTPIRHDLSISITILITLSNHIIPYLNISKLGWLLAGFMLSQHDGEWNVSQNPHDICPGLPSTVPWMQGPRMTQASDWRCSSLPDCFQHVQTINYLSVVVGCVTRISWNHCVRWLKKNTWTRWKEHYWLVVSNICYFP